ncbi:MAG TPA: histidine kinase dimerization/phospho-acceptor domain-containing protein, partial [Rhizobium sp.]|nr:histidine kinase dimerization/phospho-acceptor domain-containing protein [Rhizobium sp.]
MNLIDKLLPGIRAPRRYLGLAVGLVFLFSTLATGLYWWQMTTSATRLRQETLSQAELRGGQIAAATAHVISGLFRAVDISAIELANHYVSDAATFDRKVKEVEARLPAGSVIQVGVVDRNGYLAYSNLGMSERTFLGDREHVKVHVESTEDRLFVSRPLLGRVSKQWTVQFTRPMRRNGALVGVVVMSVSPTYLRNALTSLTLGSDDSAAIFRLSGEYLARNLNHESSLGKSAPADRPFLGDAAPATGMMRVISNFDGTPRIYRWQRLSDYPITVVLGLSEGAFLAPVERIIALDRRNGMIGTGLLWSFAFAVAFLFKRQRAAERALAELNAELEQRVVERTAQLETANRELADFSYSISHDLRSPLRAVASFAKILEDDYAASLGEEGRRMVRVIQQSGVRMGRLIDGLLDYLALSRKKLQFVRIDMGKLAGEAVALEAASDRT